MRTDIQTVGFDADEDLLNFVNDRIKHLSKLESRITGIDVYLKTVNNDQDNTKIAEIKIFLPGPTLYADYQADSFRESIMEAADKVKRQLLKKKDLQNEKRQ